MIYKSYPKINLFLSIGKKNKKNNLHKLNSVFLLVENSVYDEIKINLNEKEEDEISYFDSTNKTLIIENCIFKKTISYLKEKEIIDKNLFFKIKIKKNIPLFSGLGSGSSNVACLFKFLLEIKQINYFQIKKHILNIGSDVLFFIKNYKAAFVYKYGNKVKKVKNPNLKIKLFFTNIECSTKKVFEDYETNQSMCKNSYLKQFLYFKIKRYWMLENDLKESVFNLYKDLSIKHETLQKKYDKKIFLTGSGGTLFLIEDK
ncbi:4-(cytidine 5'-diphospho)-2-C-methyl-D-erythritol kinase [Malacoplasma penetrans]|nr:4-(cytidine 5'-diphospho)-2-C-methyl-D-erythritol kinase [Malacoplasma penetrans]RXY96876.1 4-(cytidine 5'-diphospho)-2-C-methyl-D-erythritol kinase [Malacoplasma penetrans]